MASLTSIFFETASEILHQVGEVVAPTVKTPLEDFKTHWRTIRNFYIDERYEEEAFQTSELPEHLVSMITILLEEEREENKEQKKISYQPCLEFFMQNRIMETLCKLGEKDLPVGVRKFVLTQVTTLLTDMPHSLLPNMSVHKPIRSLVLECSKTKDIEKSEFATFLSVLVELLKRDPTLIPFFFEETMDHDQKVYEFVIFPALMCHLYDDGVAGDRAKEGILTVFQYKDPMMIDYALKHMNICKLLVSDLVASFKSLPQLKIGTTTKSPLFTAFKDQLAFCNTIIKTVDNEISDTLLRMIEEDLFDSALAPSLLQPDDDAARSATTYLKESIHLIDAPKLMKKFVVFLLGDFEEVETEDDGMIHFLRKTIIERMNADDERLCISTLKLFETLIGLYNRDIMYNLIFRSLIPRLHLKPAQKGDGSDLDGIQSTIASFLTFLPDSEHTYSSGYDAYLLDAQQQIVNSKKSCSNWPSDPLNPTHDTKHTTIESSDLLSEEESASKFYGGGLFIQILFTKLASMFQNSFDTNLILTGIVARLAQYPFPLLYRFLLDKHLPLRNNVMNLWSVLAKLSQEFSTRSSEMDHFKDQLAHVRQEMAEEMEVKDESAESIQQKKFLQGVIILEEFVKELAATLAVWAS